MPAWLHGEKHSNGLYRDRSGARSTDAARTPVVRVYIAHEKYNYKDYSTQSGLNRYLQERAELQKRQEVSAMILSSQIPHSVDKPVIVQLAACISA